MGSEKKTWKLKIANSAKKSIESLNKDFRKEIIQNLQSLVEDPFQGDIERIEGKKDFYRLRIGSYRLYFKVLRKSRTIEVPLFDSKGEIKLRKIQRLK